MTKLFKLKEWLTVADAAGHLTIAFGEPVTNADVLRLALDGRLRISVHFVNRAYLPRGTVVGIEEGRQIPVDLVSKFGGRLEDRLREVGKKIYGQIFCPGCALNSQEFQYTPCFSAPSGREVPSLDFFFIRRLTTFFEICAAEHSDCRSVTCSAQIKS